MVAEISPFSLGASFQGVKASFATVQPQKVGTKLIITSPDEMFVRLKVKCASGVPLVTVTSFWSASKARKVSIPGCAAAAGGGTTFTSGAPCAAGNDCAFTQLQKRFPAATAKANKKLIRFISAGR